MASVYEINKGVNKAIEFKGLKAQYIGYLGAGLVVLLLLFAITYMIGMPVYVSLGLVAILGYILFAWVFRFSHKYGQYGLMKEAAYRRVPVAINCRSRKVFLELKRKEEYDDSDDDIRNDSVSSVNTTVKGS